jgi:hypothetical protein
MPIRSVRVDGQYDAERAERDLRTAAAGMRRTPSVRSTPTRPALPPSWTPPEVGPIADARDAVLLDDVVRNADVFLSHGSADNDVATHTDLPDASVFGPRRNPAPA